MTEPNLQSLPDLVNLVGKRALVTGGSKGIGAAIATRLSEAGARVTVADLDASGADFAEGIVGQFVQCDITNAASWQQPSTLQLAIPTSTLPSTTPESSPPPGQLSMSPTTS